MDLQLNLFGLWEAAPCPPTPPPPHADDALPRRPVDPGQGEFFAEVTRSRRAGEDAAEALDPVALRDAHAALGADQGLVAEAKAWPRWAEALAALRALPRADAPARLAEKRELRRLAPGLAERIARL